MKNRDLKSLESSAREWINHIHGILPDGKRDWVGIYWLESFLIPGSSSTDLVVGPYVGPPTPHTRIQIGSGLCGLSVKENRTVNVSDVRAEPRFLACSTQTRSEIVIPIRLKNGDIVGELDIDSNDIGSFTAEDQKRLEDEVKKFGTSLSDELPAYSRD